MATFRSLMDFRQILLVSCSCSALTIFAVTAAHGQNFDQITAPDPVTVPVAPAAPPKSDTTLAPSPTPETADVSAGIRRNPYGPFDTKPGDILPQANPPDTSPPNDTAKAGPPGNIAPSLPDTSVASTTGTPSPVTLLHPDVIDSAKLSANGRVVPLFGIVGLAGDDSKGLKTYLAKAGDQLTCEAKTGGDFVCLLPDGTDIAMVALVNGVAQARLDAPDAYREQENAAQAARRGIWANLPPPPIPVKHPVLRDSATFEVESKTYRLDGIDGVSGPIAESLQSYVTTHGDGLTCQQQGVSAFYTCLLPDGTDLAEVALVNGVAYVAPNATSEYRAQQHDAIVNKRGIWATMAPAQIASYEAPPAASEQDTGLPTEVAPSDVGISYVGGQPTAVVDGEIVFLAFAGAAGWGYYDHVHRWHGAPDRFAHHLNEFHPEGRGLHGYGAGGIREAHLRGEAIRPPGMNIASIGHGPQFERPGFGGRPEFGNHPGFPGGPQIGRPGLAGNPAFNRPSFVSAPSHFAAAQPGAMGGRSAFSPPAARAIPGQVGGGMERSAFTPQPNRFSAPQGGMMGRPMPGFSRPVGPVARPATVAVARPAPAPAARHK